MSFDHVVIVGASSGIGAALARQLARGGANVAIVGRRQKELDEVAAAGSGRIRAYVADTRTFDEIPHLFQRIVEDLGGLDTLVYAAGVMPRVEEGEYDFHTDQAIVDVNLLGAMAWMNLAVPRFEAARTGTVVGISSIAGERGRRKNPAYCASKAALTTYLEALRNRCSRYGVNVVTIKPGFVDTAMTRGQSGLFWLVSADEAAKQIIRLMARASSASAFVPARWGAVALVVRSIPSWVFRRLNF